MSLGGIKVQIKVGTKKQTKAQAGIKNYIKEKNAKQENLMPYQKMQKAIPQHRTTPHSPKKSPPKNLAKRAGKNARQRNNTACKLQLQKYIFAI